ncbi:DGQHR domain-containing protein [Xinfangfangia sp. D13-10-4-6]|uniref:DGQHR domain-containing protein n=1 Tax=Pseudogemmobacter hezensis TaxID=2737662 RepID=UPI0015523CD3|nr:DGQHR domain-containing protein [Pseudogemmobacter hezensis]NPD16133.1 DGQHR domain-containing protein [Pseudogemmobacter hezensis]
MTVINVLRVAQPIGEFYIGAIDSRALLEITTVDVRNFSLGNAGEIDGIQRELSRTRLRDLSQYVNLDYATFPTSVILAIDSRCVDLSDIPGCQGLKRLEISSYDGEDGGKPIPLEASAFVIDGQHRLAGLANRDDSKGPFDVNVSIFVGADISDQAEIFSRVNLAQTKVNKSLTYDLLDYARDKSPYKVAHDIVVALNADERGPFYRKIKRLGVRTPGVDGETLAQATVVEGLLRYLPQNQEKERTKSIFGRSRFTEPNEDWRQRIFAKFYRDDDSLSIYMNVSNFFEAVSDKWGDAWTSPGEGQILPRTTGYNALIRFMKDAYLSVVSEPRIVEKEEFAAILELVNIDGADLNKDNYLPGSAGAGKLYGQLVQQALPSKYSQGTLFD